MGASEGKMGQKVCRKVARYGGTSLVVPLSANFPVFCTRAASRFPFHPRTSQLPSIPPPLITAAIACNLCPAQRVLQGEGEGEGEGRLPQAQGETADRGRSQGLPGLDHAGGGHRAGDRRAENAGRKVYVSRSYRAPFPAWQSHSKLTSIRVER